MIAALIGTVNAQNKTTMLEVHDFIGFENGNTPTLDGNGGIVSLNDRIYGSWIDGNPRFTISSGDWKTWHAGGNGDNPTYLWAPDNSTFTINGLFAGDVVTVITYGNCSVNGNSLGEGSHEFTIESDGTFTINCDDSYPGIQKVSIATQHMATYVIDHQTYTFTSGGVLPDKRKAVPYITMSFGNESMDYAYVKYYGEENGQKQFGSFMLTETMDDTYFYDYNTNFEDVYYEHQPDWNNVNGPYVLKEPVVFKGKDFSEYVPWHGTYYYFYPETNGKLYVHMHSDPVTAAPLGSNDVMFLWDKTSNDGNDASSFNYNTEGFYRFGTDAQNGVRVKKNHVYFMCTTPNDPRRRNVAHLIDYTFIPDFTMTPLYKVVDPGCEPTEARPIEAATLAYTDHMDPTTLHYRVKKCLGNIESATVKIENNKLYFTNITYKSGKANKGGAVIVDVDCTDGQADFVLTVPYSAEPIDGTGKDVKKWDFYSNIIDNATVDYNQIDNNGQTYQPFVDADASMMGKIHLGQWKTEGSGLRYETDKDPGEWLNTYINLEGDGTEPIFKNVYDIEGDNADMIWDTNGLIFHAQSTSTGIYNENDAPSSAFQDRYIGLMKGSEFTIPRLAAGDRIVIKMGTYGNLTEAPETTTLTITNAKDAVGTDISGDYVIGGSAPIEDDIKDDNGNYVPRGEYHFIAAGNNNGDVTFKVKDGQLLKLYTIQIYKNDNAIVSENEVKGDLQKNKRYILNTQDGTADNAVLHLIYRGLNEVVDYEAHEKKTGNLEQDGIIVSSDHDDETNDYWYTYVVPKGKFGVFKTRLGVNTINNNTYVTDYADCMIPVGYLETMTYPYTWDFTDLKKYVATGTSEAPNGIDASGNELNVNETDLKIWDEYGLRTNSEEYDGYIFAPGGQLYGGTTMFDETRGIGIFHKDVDNKAMTMNGSANAADGGLAVSDEFGFVVPQVKKGQAVYVHATAGDGATAQYAIGNGAKQTLSKVGTNAYAMKMADDATTANVTLYFKGCEINKIAVSDFAKSVNKLGYASESRAEEIDPELMGYMTGTGLKAYTVSKVTYGDNAGDVPTIELKAVPSENVIGAATHHDHNAYIIYNTDAAVNGTKAVNALDGGFHLFVPDMHDKSTMGDEAKKSKLDVSGNGLRAWLPEDPTTEVMYQTYTYTTGTDGSITAEGGTEGKKEYTTYVLSSKGINTATNQEETDVERFRRVKANVIAGNNKAYLPLLTANVKPSNGSGAKGMFAIVFVDEEEGTETTSLDGVESIERTYNDGSYYTLGGVKVQNPTKKGIYIKNGKKVVIK